MPGLPAYTDPAWPFGLNGDPFALADLPGVEVAFELPHVVPGAPGCPGPFGLGSAAATPEIPNVATTAITPAIAIDRTFLTSVILSMMWRKTPQSPTDLSPESCRSLFSSATLATALARSTTEA